MEIFIKACLNNRGIKVVYNQIISIRDIVYFIIRWDIFWYSIDTILEFINNNKYCV